MIAQLAANSRHGQTMSPVLLNAKQTALLHGYPYKSQFRRTNARLKLELLGTLGRLYY